MLCNIQPALCPICGQRNYGDKCPSCGNYPEPVRKNQPYNPFSDRAALRVIGLCLLILICFSRAAYCQAEAPSTGEVTVHLVQGLDSATARPGQASAGFVIKSTNPDVTPRSSAVVQLLPNPTGGFMVQLVRLGINGQVFRTASSDAALAGIVGKVGGLLHSPNSVSGARVFLPPGTDVRFTLTSPPAQGPVARRPVPSAPVAPAHPAATVVDLPPGAPGYPPLHASRPAAEGCWWVPFVSQTFKLEIAVQQCAPPAFNTVLGESKDGITQQYQKPPLAPPDVIFTVHTKPAQQTIEAAIKQQFISHLTEAGARTSCQAKRDTDGIGKWDSYSVSATGPYAKLKKFNSSEPGGDVPCENLQSGDVSNYFLYQPAESKTKFLFIQGQADSPSVLPWDESSIRFLPEQVNQ